MARPDAELAQAIASVTEGALLVYLFGSVGTPYERPDSDLDVAVLYAAPLTFEQRVEVSARIAEATGRTIDLVDLGSADPIIRRQVIATGTVVREDGRGVRARFEMRTLSEHHDLKIERRAAERELVERWP